LDSYTCLPDCKVLFFRCTSTVTGHEEEYDSLFLPTCMNCNLYNEDTNEILIYVSQTQVETHQLQLFFVNYLEQQAS